MLHHPLAVAGRIDFTATRCRERVGAGGRAVASSNRGQHSADPCLCSGGRRLTRCHPGEGEGDYATAMGLIGTLPGGKMSESRGADIEQASLDEDKVLGMSFRAAEGPRCCWAQVSFRGVGGDIARSRARPHGEVIRRVRHVQVGCETSFRQQATPPRRVDARSHRRPPLKPEFLDEDVASLNAREPEASRKPYGRSANQRAESRIGTIDDEQQTAIDQEGTAGSTPERRLHRRPAAAALGSHLVRQIAKPAQRSGAVADRRNPPGAPQRSPSRQLRHPRGQRAPVPLLGRRRRHGRLPGSALRQRRGPQQLRRRPLLGRPSRSAAPASGCRPVAAVLGRVERPAQHTRPAAACTGACQHHWHEPQSRQPSREARPQPRGDRQKDGRRWSSKGDAQPLER